MAEGKYAIKIEGIDGTYNEPPVSNGHIIDGWDFHASNDISWQGGKATRGKAQCSYISLSLNQGSEFYSKLLEQLLKSMFEKEEKGKKVTIYCLENVGT